MELKNLTLEIIEEIKKASNPKESVKRSIHYDENKNSIIVDGKIYVLAVGKASVGMIEGFLKVLKEEKIEKGFIVIPYGYNFNHPKFEVFHSGHPLPDENSERAGIKILNFLENINPEDLVIFLLSGGGSALFVLPIEGINLEGKIETTRVLLSCGARIQEINTVRKHLSGIKGEIWHLKLKELLLL